VEIGSLGRWRVVECASAAVPILVLLSFLFLPAPTHGRLILSDTFNRPGALSKWHPILGGGGFGNRELQYYTARRRNVAIVGGKLELIARREVYTGADHVRRAYTSGAIETKGLFQTEYGGLEARIKLPAGRGLWPAFWAVGSDVGRVGWPRSGEIDVMENLGRDPFTVLGSIHGPEPGKPRGYALTSADRASTSLAAGYHTYAVLRSPGRIVFSLDGVPYATRTRASLPRGARWVFDKPFFLILTLAVGGSWPGPPDATTRFPATMSVDWVRAYAS
jgi:beta-glucanase (GH16 family)